MVWSLISISCFIILLVGRNWASPPGVPRGPGSSFRNSPLNSGNTQSQDQKTFFRPNPVANCLWVKNIKKKSKSIYENAIPIRANKLESTDIDNYDDFLGVKAILESKKKNFFN